MKRKKLDPQNRVACARALLGATVLILISGCSAERESVSIGLPREPVGALLTIAVDRGFLADEGLDVTVRDSYPSGKRALLAMLAGEVDVSATSEVPIVFNAGHQPTFRVLATIGASNNGVHVIARTDRGIQLPSDLAGKHIATQKGSAVHYFLHRFMAKHNLTKESTQLSFLAAEDLPKALSQGKIDAVAVREPYLGEAKQQLAGKAIVFSEPGLYTKTFNLVATNQLLNERPDVVRRVLRAVMRAEQFMIENPQLAVQTVARRYGMEASEAEATLAAYELHVSLRETLVAAMDDEAEWAITNGLLAEAARPAFANVVSGDQLRSLKADSVTHLTRAKP